MKFLAAILAVALVATTANAGAPFTVGKIADEWGTIQPAGPRTGTNGSRFLNMEGSSNGSFASTGTLRFYMEDVVAQFDAQFGAGNWAVDNVRIVLEHNDAGFSTAGNLNVYHFTNDNLAITSGESVGDAAPGEFGGLSVSPLLYNLGANALQTRTAGDTAPTNIFGTFTQIDDYNFIPKGSGDLDVLGDVLKPLDLSSTVTAGPSYAIPNLAVTTGDSLADTDAEINTAGSLLDIATLANDIESGTDALSLLFVPDTSDVAATYKGNPFGDLYSPRIYITAVPEPATMTLLGLGGLLAIRRRRA